MSAPRDVILTVADVRPYLRQLYDEHPAGCCLHIVTDDGNLEHGDVEFCMNEAEENGHDLCLALAIAIRSLSFSQRRRLITHR